MGLYFLLQRGLRLRSFPAAAVNPDMEGAADSIRLLTPMCASCQISVQRGSFDPSKCAGGWAPSARGVAGWLLGAPGLFSTGAAEAGELTPYRWFHCCNCAKDKGWQGFAGHACSQCKQHAAAHAEDNSSRLVRDPERVRRCASCRVVVQLGASDPEACAGGWAPSIRGWAVWLLGGPGPFAVGANGTGPEKWLHCCRCAESSGWPDFEGRACIHCRHRAAAGALRLSPSGAAAADEEAGMSSAADGAGEVMARARAEARRVLEEARAILEEAERGREAARRESEEAQREQEAAARVRLAAEEARLEALRHQREAEVLHWEAAQAAEAARVELQAAQEGGRAVVERGREGASATGERLSGTAPQGSVRIFFHGELAAATRDFAAEMLLGRGGFGGVYRAKGVRGVGAGAEVAVKRLEGDSLQGQSEFLQEVQVLGGCRHENLLPLIGFSADGGEEGGVCLVFPLMQGGSLEDRLEAHQAREPLGWVARVRVALSVSLALEYLHTPDPTSHKPAILHRDVKPSNILLDQDGLVRLADVGLAKTQAAHKTHVTLTSVAGTAGFIDPSYMQTGHFDAACDAFSLGITVLVLLTGLPAFERGQALFDRCDGQDAAEVADTRAGWPPAKAAEVLRVGLALAEPRRRRRMPVGEAVAALRRLAEESEEGEGAHPLEGAQVRECLLCLAAPKSVRLGCGHATYCNACWELAQSRPAPQCPYCRQPVGQFVAFGGDIEREDTFVRPLRPS